ncbi:uncharacterized protein LOC128102256 [Peromyscus californicus insignis]|uniref:uncharacterized protein LOC128102256 n=1 Tax=Peromyscus californicus insignis TaxID=564181 RepID=UPI0022A754A3|nr:uncharacterized protein LOC128102256 [Peromyscus californicus insignis]
MKFEQNISASNTLSTRLAHKCSCVEKTHQLENEDGGNLAAPSSATGSTHACMAHYPWMSENDARELSKGLGDLKQSVQLSLETQKKQNSGIEELAGIGKPFKIINRECEIGECGSHRDFGTCQLGRRTPVSTQQCSAQRTTKPYSEFLRESYTTSTINVMETKIRSLKSTLSKLKVSRALSALELERYKYLYHEELSIRKSFQYYLNNLCRSNENSEKSRTKLHMEMQHGRSAGNAQSLRLFTECSSAGNFDSIPGPRISLLRRENLTASSLNSQPSTTGLEDCLGMVSYGFQFKVLVQFLFSTWLTIRLCS